MEENLFQPMPVTKDAYSAEITDVIIDRRASRQGNLKKRPRKNKRPPPNMKASIRASVEHPASSWQFGSGKPDKGYSKIDKPTGDVIHPANLFRGPKHVMGDFIKPEITPEMVEKIA